MTAAARLEIPTYTATECPGVCLCRSPRGDGQVGQGHSWSAEPTLYADTTLARVIAELDQLLCAQGADAEPQATEPDDALRRYVRARRAAGMSPEAVLVEFKKLLRPVVGLDLLHPSSTRAGCHRAALARGLIRRVIELCFEG